MNHIYSVPNKLSKASSEVSYNSDDHPVIPERTWTEYEEFGSMEDIQMKVVPSNVVIDEPCTYIVIVHHNNFVSYSSMRLFHC